MQLDFFPSRTITLYLARLFAVRIAAMLAILVLVLMMLDLLGKSGDILAVPGNGQAEVWRYVSLRLPQHLLDAIKAAANARDVPHPSLIKVWLQEKLQSFQQRREAAAAEEAKAAKDKAEKEKADANCTRARNKLAAAEVLRQCGLPVSRHQIAASAADAVAELLASR